MDAPHWAYIHYHTVTQVYSAVCVAHVAKKSIKERFVRNGCVGSHIVVTFYTFNNTLTCDGLVWWYRIALPVFINHLSLEGDYLKP